MRFTAPLLLTPLLASAIPTNKPLVLQGAGEAHLSGIEGKLGGDRAGPARLALVPEEDRGRASFIANMIKDASISTEGFSLDLDELRLVQFDEEMPPV